MVRKKRSRTKSFFSVVLIFGVVFATALFGIQFITKTGFFRIPGVVYYDESLSSDELSVLKTIFTEEVDLDKDVTISAYETLEKPEPVEGEYIYNIYVLFHFVAG